jgi:hypothetical protein
MNQDGFLLEGFVSTQEFPLDLGAEIEKELIAVELLIADLRSRPVSPDTAGLLAETILLRNHLALLKTHVLTIYRKVIIDPADDDYLILKAISSRLDNAILSSGLANTSTGHIHLLVNTIRKGLQIADNLTAC